MKKTTRKLVLRKETVRALSGQELSRALGGLETDTTAPYPQTGCRQCGGSSGLVATLGVPRDGD
jgi:hypothetical protein